MSETGTEALKRVESVFHAALERKPGEREAYVELACADCPALRSRVLTLLRADAQDTDPLSDARITPLARSVRTRAPGGDDLAGQRVGAYRLISRLGEGGMGSVWLGVRDDQEFERRVAVKVIKRGMDSEQVLRRFRVERRALGVLEHPSVARLLDAVMTPDGRPALIMELVEGKPLDEYCADAGLALRERLELFLGVCDGVSYAHRMLVVHRDLKPSNICVTPRGEPKLIDFGIAKILAGDDTQATVTAVEQRVLTPRYASPEQVRGEPVTTATDVFSLGVVLYELLSGRAPFESPSGSRAEIGRLVCEQDPVRPSTAVTLAGVGEHGEKGVARPVTGAETQPGTTRLRRLLEGDLDTIVLKALRKEPGRRYASVAELSDDIRRYLDDRPVLARPDTLGYRTRKFVRRHRGMVAGVSLFLATLCAGLGAVSWMLVRTRDAEASEMAQREVAEDRLVEADSVAGFLEDMLASATPDHADGRAPEVLREILDAAEVRMEQELGDQPRVRARIQHTLASSYRQIGDYEKSETHFAQALATRRAQHVPGNPDLSRTLHEYALLAMDRSDHERAQALVSEAIETLGETRSRAAANAHDLLGVIAMETARFDEAERQFATAVEIYESCVPRDDDALLQCYGKQGVLLARAGRNAEAIGVLERAVERAESGNRSPNIGRLSLQNNLAVLYRRDGKNESALAMYDRIIEASETLLGSEHRLAMVPRSNRAMVLHKLGRHDEADRAFSSVYEAQRDTIGESHEDTVTTLFNHAQLRVDQGDLESAEPMFKRALELNTASYGPMHPNVAMTHGAWGRAVARFGGEERRAEAEAHLVTALETFRSVMGQDHPVVGAVERDLGMVRAGEIP